MPTEFFIRAQNNVFVVERDFSSFDVVNYEVIFSSYKTNVSGFRLKGFVDMMKEDYKVKQLLPAGNAHFEPPKQKSGGDLVQRLYGLEEGNAYLLAVFTPMPGYKQDYLTLTTISNEIPAARYIHIKLHNMALCINHDLYPGAVIEDVIGEMVPDRYIQRLVEKFHGAANIHFQKKQYSMN